MNKTITLAATREENKNEFLKLVKTCMDVLKTDIPTMADTFKETRPEFRDRFIKSYEVLEERVVKFAEVLKEGTADMEAVRDLAWDAITACVSVQEGFCDAEYFGCKNDKAHLHADGVEELFAIVHSDADHLLENGETPLFRVWDKNRRKLLETNNRDEFTAKCQELGIPNYELALEYYDNNGGKPSLLNIPTAIYRENTTAS